MPPARAFGPVDNPGYPGWRGARRNPGRQRRIHPNASPTQRGRAVTARSSIRQRVGRHTADPNPPGPMGNSSLSTSVSSCGCVGEPASRRRWISKIPESRGHPGPRALETPDDSGVVRRPESQGRARLPDGKGQAEGLRLLPRRILRGSLLPDIWMAANHGGTWTRPARGHLDRPAGKRRCPPPQGD